MEKEKARKTPEVLFYADLRTQFLRGQRHLAPFSLIPASVEEWWDLIQNMFKNPPTADLTLLRDTCIKWSQSTGKTTAEKKSAKDENKKMRALTARAFFWMLMAHSKHNQVASLSNIKLDLPTICLMFNDVTYAPERQVCEELAAIHRAAAKRKIEDDATEEEEESTKKGAKKAKKDVPEERKKKEKKEKPEKKEKKEKPEKKEKKEKKEKPEKEKKEKPEKKEKKEKPEKKEKAKEKPEKKGKEKTEKETKLSENQSVDASKKVDVEYFKFQVLGGSHFSFAPGNLQFGDLAVPVHPAANLEKTEDKKGKTGKKEERKTGNMWKTVTADQASKLLTDSKQPVPKKGHRKSLKEAVERGALSVVSLKELCSALGLTKTGSKEELQLKVLAFY